MAKMRVYELAKEFQIKSESLIHLLREMDIPVRSHMSALDEGQVARARTRLERDKRRPDKKGGKADAAGRRRRRRVVEKPEPVEVAAEELAEVAEPAIGVEEVGEFEEVPGFEIAAEVVEAGVAPAELESVPSDEEVELVAAEAAAAEEEDFPEAEVPADEEIPEFAAEAAAEPAAPRPPPPTPIFREPP